MLDGSVEVNGAVGGSVETGYRYRINDPSKMVHFLKELAMRSECKGEELLEIVDSVQQRRGLGGYVKGGVKASVSLFEGWDLRSEKISAPVGVSSKNLLGEESSLGNVSINKEGAGGNIFGVELEASVNGRAELKRVKRSNIHEETTVTHKVGILHAGVDVGVVSAMAQKGLDLASSRLDLDCEGGMNVTVEYATETERTKDPVTAKMTDIRWRKELHLELGAVNLMAQACTKVARGDRIPFGLTLVLPRSIDKIKKEDPNLYENLKRLGELGGQSAYYKVVYKLPVEELIKYNDLRDAKNVTQRELRQEKARSEKMKAARRKIVYGSTNPSEPQILDKCMSRREKEADEILKTKRVPYSVEAYKTVSKEDSVGCKFSNFAAYKFERVSAERRLGMVHLS